MGLRDYMEEDPVVISHLLWAFLGINVTGGAKEMYRNAPTSNGLEVWRRLHRHIFSRNEQRRAELFRQIHRPRAATKPSEVASALEEWETLRRLHREVGGTPLREEELKERVLDIVPWEIKKDLIRQRNDGTPWRKMLDDIKDLARLSVGHGGKAAPAMNLTPDVDLNNLAEEYWEATDQLEMEQATA